MGKGGEVEGEEEEQKVDWLGQLQSRITLRQVLAAEDEPTFLIRAARRYPDGTYAEIYRQVSDLVASAHRDKSISKNLAFLKQHLSPPHAQLHVLHFHGHTDSSHSLFSSRPSKANAVVGSAAKLHTMFGLTSFDTATSRARGMAREACYDTRNYRAANFYGPFKDDGSGAVHWPQMEALSVVLALNVLDVRRHAHEDDQDDAPPHPPPPQGFASAGPSGILEECPLFEGLAAARPYTQPKTIGTEEAPGDWAGVQGKWTRIVCFLDFRDLHRYVRSSTSSNLHSAVGPGRRFNFGPLGLNFGQAPTHGFGIGPGTPETDPGLLSPGSAMIIGGGQIWSRPRLDDYTEAIRLMTLDLKVTSVGEPAEGAVVPDGMANGGPRYPPIFFNGTSACVASNFACRTVADPNRYMKAIGIWTPGLAGQRLRLAHARWRSSLDAGLDVSRPFPGLASSGRLTRRRGNAGTRVKTAGRAKGSRSEASGARWA